MCISVRFKCICGLWPPPFMSSSQEAVFSSQKAEISSQEASSSSQEAVSSLQEAVSSSQEAVTEQLYSHSVEIERGGGPVRSRTRSSAAGSPRAWSWAGPAVGPPPGGWARSPPPSLSLGTPLLGGDPQGRPLRRNMDQTTTLMHNTHILTDTHIHNDLRPIKTTTLKHRIKGSSYLQLLPVHHQNYKNKTQEDKISKHEIMPIDIYQ